MIHKKEALEVIVKKMRRNKHGSPCMCFAYVVAGKEGECAFRVDKV